MFVGRRSARAFCWFALVVFLGIELISVGLVPFVSDRQTNFFLVMAGFTSVVMIPMCLLVSRQLLMTYSTLSILYEGLALKHPLGQRIVPWDKMTKIEQTEAATNTVTIRVKGERSLRLPLILIEDGAELGRYLREKIAGPQGSLAFSGTETRTLRSRDLGASLAAIGLLLFMTVFFAFLLSGAPKGSALIFTTLVPVILLVTLSASTWTAYVRVSPPTIEVGSIFKRQQLPFEEIETVEEKGPTLTVAGKGRTLTIGKRMNEFDGIVATIRDRAKNATFVERKPPVPEIQPGAAELAEGRVFRIGKDVAVSGYVLAVIGGFFVVAGLAVGVKSEPGVQIGLMAFSAIFGGLLVFSGLAIIKRSVQLVDGRVIYKTLVSKRVVELSELKRVELTAYVSNKSAKKIERIYLENNAGGIAVSSEFDDYQLFRDAVISQVPMEIVRTDRMLDV
jgi:hypothetical protein